MSDKETTGIYIFCAIQSETAEDFGVIEIEGENKELFTIRYKDAAIVAAEAPMKIYQPNKDNLSMHQNAVSLVMKKNSTVIPVSFGNIFHSKEDVGVLLENLYPQFEKLFPAIQGKVELGLKVIGKKAWLESKVSENSNFKQMAKTVRGKSEAAAYYERIQLGGAAKQLIDSLQQQVEQDIFNPLRELAEASTTNAPIGEKMLLNAAFLVDRQNENRFDEKVNELYEKWKDRVEFSYTGPWAAYNFVNIRLKVEDA
ncbi:GvpL/GvpF family gas vesicle protein [Paenibacillus xerothermodurans]|uniref:Gas vesicle protein GvpF n=1 Tax=Paenibacillus xerothermodurans TaxID=1977292 RepID=A0A2W1N7Z1_PAEXE|nr:GvpL/GvpF family gas vesicle protein [Paenibacillus xerothermodurans]PZE19730.1 gas vesicle protein GvpF [Paenibacillus xerothermodurans]